MHLRSLPTMERISVPVRRHPEHYFVVQRSVRLIAIILYQGYNTLKQGLFHIKAVTALLRESHTLNKAVTAVFTSKAAARYKAVIVLRHTTALLRDPYCIYIKYQIYWHSNTPKKTGETRKFYIKPSTTRGMSVSTR